LHIHETGPLTKERHAELIQELNSKPASVVGYRYWGKYEPAVSYGHQDSQSIVPLEQRAVAISGVQKADVAASEPAPYTVSREGQLIGHVPAVLIEEAAAGCPALAQALWGPNESQDEENCRGNRQRK
jgi:hypothetical protein